MKIEKLSKGKFIKTSIIVLVVVSILGVIFINKSKAKYRVTQSIQIVNGEVNYTNPDFSMLGVKLQSAKGSSDYVSASNNEVPTSGYKLKALGNGATDSYCTINGERNNAGISISYTNGSVSFNGIKKQGTRCYLFFDLQTDPSGSELLAKYTVNSTSDGCPAYPGTSGDGSVSVTSVESSKSLFCKGRDDLGDTYYFRGNPTNNWVKLGNFYWRIVRFNGNGSIRLIYSGNGKAETSGTGTQTKTLAYNTYSSKNNVKYNNSTIRNELDSWYTKNLVSYKDKLDGKAGFCNDADMTNSTDFKPYTRIYTNKKPTFKCGTPTTNLYTTTGNTNGNQQLGEIPIGLITIDEASFAGGTWGDSNSGYYLHTGEHYYTMSPNQFIDNLAGMCAVHSTGDLYGTSYLYGSGLGVRPVINLKADTLFKEGADGSKENPYEVII